MSRLDDFLWTSQKPRRMKRLFFPTRQIVNTRANEQTIRKIHPTHITNVNKNIKRIENYYPVTESTQNGISLKEYDCGSDIKNR
ncbi:CotD family spore coat protein [Bacillus sp. SL00103]